MLLVPSEHLNLCQYSNKSLSWQICSHHDSKHEAIPQVCWKPNTLPQLLGLAYSVIPERSVTAEFPLQAWTVMQHWQS